MHLQFAIQFFLAMFAAMVSSHAIIAFTKKIGCIDQPKEEAHKTHQVATPLAGGLILALVLNLAWFLPNLTHDSRIIYLLLSTLLAGLFGLLDDLIAMRARWKIAGQAVAITVLISGKVHLNLFHLSYIDVPITVFWLFGITNAFNLIDGLDGLAPGLASLALAFISVSCMGSAQLTLASISAIAMGACMWIYYLNVNPAKIFLGDCGSQMLGFLIASLLLLYTPPGFSVGTSWFLPVMLTGVIIFDTTLVVTTRLLNNQAIYVGNRDHIHHRLITVGMAPSRAALTIHMISGAISILGFFALKSSALVANSIFLATCSLGLGLILFLNRRLFIRTFFRKCN